MCVNGTHLTLASPTLIPRLPLVLIDSIVRKAGEKQIGSCHLLVSCELLLNNQPIRNVYDVIAGINL